MFNMILPKKLIWYWKTVVIYLELAHRNIIKSHKNFETSDKNKNLQHSVIRITGISDESFLVRTPKASYSNLGILKFRNIRQMLIAAWILELESTLYQSTFKHIPDAAQPSVNKKLIERCHQTISVSPKQ